MGRMSLETRAKVIAMKSSNYSLRKIKEHLEGGVSVSKVLIYMLIKKYEKTNTIKDIKQRFRAMIIHENHYCFMDNLMAENNDLTSKQLHSALVSECPEL